MMDKKAKAIRALRISRSHLVVEVMTARQRTDELAGARLMVLERELAGINDQLRRYTAR